MRSEAFTRQVEQGRREQAPVPVLDRQTKQQKADANGDPPYSIELVPIVAEGGRVLNVQFPGTPPAGIL
ncbi:MAG: hypothetical protein QOD49_2631 [Actinomycetota bacterium]|jgi:hypothetical protein|nr:hypothetical protein [Actinomycetota bacterium]